MEKILASNETFAVDFEANQSSYDFGLDLVAGSNHPVFGRSNAFL